MSTKLTADIVADASHDGQIGAQPMFWEQTQEHAAFINVAFSTGADRVVGELSVEDALSLIESLFTAIGHAKATREHELAGVRRVVRARSAVARERWCISELVEAI